MATRPGRAQALALRAWPALFGLPLIRPALAGSPQLGDYAGQVLGFDATLCLVATLFITPLLSAVKVPAAKLRWWYGIWMFTLGFAGLALALTITAGTPGERAAGSAVNWTGTLIVVLLLPAAAMSNAACQKLMGGEWKRWQRNLVWAVWALVLGHVLLLHDLLTVAGFLLATLPLIALRNHWVRRKVKDWRMSKYEDRRWWRVIGVFSSVFLTGVIVLLTLEVQACAAALTLGKVPLN
jgi:DMSO/TMAO reductase YedYZ heme-binding membrane subunit